jgi:uncharacterized membrane protein YkvA (DUF1232 family)
MEEATAIVHDDFYRVLRGRLRAWLQSKGKGLAFAEMLLVAPDLLHLLCRLAIDARVPSGDKARLASVIAYFVSLVDLMPEGLLGPVGYLDDVALAAFVLHKIIGADQEQVARQYWAGDGDVLEVLQRVLQLSNKAIGSGLWQRLRRIV